MSIRLLSPNRLSDGHAAPQLSPGVARLLLGPCVQWCQQTNASGPTDFRSRALKPVAERVFPQSCHTEFSGELVGAFSEFIAARVQLLRGMQMPDQELGQTLQHPRSLLLTDWSASLFDGALSVETDGFLDDDAMPPWDTWIALVQIPEALGSACLLSWVPGWMAAKVEAAIRIDAASCLSWLAVAHDRLQLNGFGQAARRVKA